MYRSQSLNGWSYVEGNPINLTDASGKIPYCEETDCPVPQPSYMHEKARITCFDLYTIGGSNPMERYLEKESYSDPEALLTRVAMTENQTNLEDRKLVMWVIRYRMEIAHSIGANSTAEQSRPTSLWREVSLGGFHAMDIIRKIENTEKVALERLGDNVNAGFYPSNTALGDDGKSVKDWITTSTMSD